MSPKKKRPKGNIKRKRPKGAAPTTPAQARVRYPRQTEVIGVIVRNLGDRRMEVLCQNNKFIVARIPGRFRRGYRIQTNDVVVVEPWADMKEGRGDIVHRYVFQEIRGLARNPRFRKILEELQVPIPSQQEGTIPY